MDSKSIFGAIIGDIVGSRFEFDNIKSKDFELFDSECSLTDDSYMTIACAKALLEYKSDSRDLSQIAKECFQSIGREFQSSYGKQFHLWLISEDPKPYNSFGNGSAMRISPVAYASTGIEEVKTLSRKITEVSHNHPEGIKGAESTAAAIFMARHHAAFEEISNYIEDEFGYDLSRTLDEIRPDYCHVEDCMKTMPESFTCFLEAGSYEECIRNVMYIGGDTDTLGAIAGAIAEAYWGIPEDLIRKAKEYLPDDIKAVVERFEKTVK